MRRIAVINQKGGVGKTTTSVNLGAALALQGRRVVLVDMDAQANLSISLGAEIESSAPSTYTVLLGQSTFKEALRPTAIPNLSLVASNIDLSGAELELAGAIGREHLMKDALSQWESEHRKAHGRPPADYVVFDCPPSLGLLSVNALAAAGEVLITLQTEFLALQGMSKLVGVVQLMRRRVNPELVITGILPCMYDSRLKLAREVLGEIRSYFGAQVFPQPVRTNVKLAEAPSFGKTIFEYAPESNGAQDYRLVAREVMRREARDADLVGLPPYGEERAGVGTSLAADVAPADAQSGTDAETTKPRPDAGDTPASPRTAAGVTTASPRTGAGVAPTSVRTVAGVAPASPRTEAGVAPASARANVAVAAASERAVAEDAPTIRAAARAAAAPLSAAAAPASDDAPAEPAATRARGRGKRAAARRAPAESSPEQALNPEAPSAKPSAPVRESDAPARDSDRAQNTQESKPSVTPSARTRKPRAPSAGSQAREREGDSTAPDSDRAESAAELKIVTITPAPASAHESPQPLRRIVRAEDLPPLPPDAFEILTSYVRDA